MSDQKITSRPSSGDTDSAMTGVMSVITGRLISLFVHETNNHLATLRESAGLGDDIISAQNLTDKEKLKELEKLLTAMDDRIGHATSLGRALGEFGRHMENPSGPMDINQAIEGLISFLSKIARQKDLKIRTSYSTKLPAVAGHFSALQCLILALFDNFCSGLEAHATAIITTDKSISSVIVKLSADCTAPSDSERQPWPWKTLESFAAANGFEVARPEQGGAVTLSIKKQNT